jgi:UDP-2,3-diacylglucosamine pyrophosphatase LpxH
MPDVRYVCLSDLHFGARSSILTGLEHVDEVDIDDPSPVLVALLDALGTLIDANESSTLPTLVLVGDVLEFALMSASVAGMVFDEFVAQAFAPGHRRFAPTVYYIPGNHDHHLWEQLRERREALRIGATRPGVRLEPEPHASPLGGYDDAATADQLLAMLIQRRPGCEDVQVVTAYPNLGLQAEEGDRVAVFHHGHFVEGIYRLVSSVKGVVFPDHNGPTDVHGWEAENHAWIDFFWSTLGQSGAAGADITRIYEMLARPDATDALIERLGHAVGDRIRAEGGLVHRGGARVVESIFRHAARFGAQRERHQTKVSLTPAGLSGLWEYLDNPVRRQLEHEFGDVPDELVFVFGHTHKPFERVMSSAASRDPVAVLNTGGWVVDSVEDDSVQGASVVLLDETLEAVSVRCYQEGSTDTDVRVRSAGFPGPFAARITELVDAHEREWDRVNMHAAALVRERHEVLDLSIEESMEVDGNDEAGMPLVAAEVADAMGVRVDPAPETVGDRGH